MSYRHKVSDLLAHPRKAQSPRLTAGEFLDSLASERWMADAACTQGDPDAWFPEPGQHSARVRMALQICRGCPVAEQCLMFALAHDLQGIWGGTTTHQRRPLRRKATAQ